LGIDDEDEMIGGDEMDLSDDESNLKKTKTKTDPIQLQVILILLFIILYAYVYKLCFILNYLTFITQLLTYFS